MSSPDDPRPDAENDEERSPAIDAEVARTAADDDLEQAAAAGPGSEPTAADRGDLPAPGAPDELHSDEADQPPAPEPAEPPAPEPQGGTDDPPPASAPPPTDATSPEQPADPAAAAAREGVEADAAVQDKDAAAAEAAAVNKQAEKPDEAVEEEPAEVDERRQALVDALREHLGDAVVDVAIIPGTDIWARVTLDAWQETARVCRDKLGLTYFCFVSAIDWMPSPYGRGEESSEPAGTTTSPEAVEPGVTGGETRFQLLARLERPGAGLGITLKADVPEGAEAPTWTTVFLGAAWHERETYEMFGIRFAGHPDLAPLYLPTDFEGHPLRKDFPLVARMVKPWPGLVDVEAMPGEPEGEEEEAATT